jgi:hypothetical protein
MDKLKSIQAKARTLARSGEFYGWVPIKFELRFMRKRASGSTARRLGKTLMVFARRRGIDQSTARLRRRTTVVKPASITNGLFSNSSDNPPRHS